MRIVHFNAHDVIGGAARAASRLHVALQAIGHDSKMYVLFRNGTDAATARVLDPGWQGEIRTYGGDLLYKAMLYWHSPKEVFTIETSLASMPTRTLVGRAEGANVLHLHWTRGLLTAQQAQRVSKLCQAPVVVTLMDFGPMTGGCHYMHGCTNFERECGSCPVISSDRARDVSRRNWRRRHRAYTAMRPTVVACNEHSRTLARRSSLFHDADIHVIPLPLDLDVFRPIARAVAREALGIAQAGRVVFCGAVDIAQRRKGFPELEVALYESVRALDATRLREEPVTILTAGKRALAFDSKLPFGSMHLGMLGDDRSLALAYSAADVFLSPSIEDAGPMMVNEALACGCPVVAFEIGTAADHVEYPLTGALAPCGDGRALGQVLASVLDYARPGEMRAACRAEAVRAFDPSAVARRYTEVYEVASGRRC